MFENFDKNPAISAITQEFLYWQSLVTFPCPPDYTPIGFPFQDLLFSPTQGTNFWLFPSSRKTDFPSAVLQEALLFFQIFLLYLSERQSQMFRSTDHCKADICLHYYELIHPLYMDLHHPVSKIPVAGIQSVTEKRSHSSCFHRRSVHLRKM